MTQSETKPPILVWFRQDLRLSDHPALEAAVHRGRPVVPLFLWSPEEESPWGPGAASRWWLHQSLKRLDAELRRHGSRLILRRGTAEETLLRLLKETGATTVVWNRRYEPGIIARDRRLKETLRGAGFEAESYNGSLLWEPWELRTKTGGPYQVFTAFWRECLSRDDPAAPLPAAEHLAGPTNWPASEPLAELRLEPRLDWAAGIRAAWQPGETGARERLDHFLDTAFADYDDGRNRPDQAGTSRLSPFLHFGEISPRQIWHALRARAGKEGWPATAWRGSQYLAEVGWREFAHHLLFHFPHTPAKPLRAEFERFPWHRDANALRSWQQGRTGFPIVDAGMRELWATGWMHNRVRMIVASFLVKDLMIPWQDGAAWFWDTLVDADLANNTLGWQWTAGCGADAAPFFRVFNPTGQGERFDPAGDYVRHWVPELARVPAKWIHRPAEAPAEVLAAAGVRLGNHYPEPMVSHAIARQVALDAWQRLKR
ncbi:MAG: deoxyribodipyrimidine photo-lyase [Verrucomicrobiales bacterium]|nr:deoxyribodipyrimidine photo-lyase [Verrucomicrobiales bacterium]